MATSSSNSSAPLSVCPSAGPGGNETTATPSLQACKSSGCKIGTYVEKTKRRCSQFVSAPYIMQKPLVVNGTTAIFQMGGQMAKVGDIPSLSAVTGGDGKAIYRIKPGTHAHVINYVLVDEGSDSMEKAKSGDQETMRMLLDSQRESATSKLQKFIANHRGTTTNNAAAPAPVPPVATPAVVTVQPPAVQPSALITTPQIHPDFSIASVEGAVSFASPNLEPIATPTALTAAPSIPPSLAPATTNNNNNAVERLQAEILELRRTVVRLQGEKLYSLENCSN
ncbi:uncharacterized protein Dwil_GK14897 [Drosophila willistoni]|uniref:Uncharacterized protein n=1 Tax=Drosophila willistoni TaxID=7260 RepID=B4MWD6_DROWI|nr:uncharacterized protein LOC6642529 [Drosophila willistoni]EDW76006.1 uncharacterized protein Dwil_GK14897 [Drosophila willistoni]